MGSIHTIWSTTAITNHLIAHVPSPAHEFKFTSRPKGIGGHLPLKCDGLGTCPWILQKMVAFCTLYIRKVRGYWHDDSVISALLYTFTLAELLEQRTSKRPWAGIQIGLALVYMYNSDWFRLDRYHLTRTTLISCAAVDSGAWIWTTSHLVGILWFQARKTTSPRSDTTCSSNASELLSYFDPAWANTLNRLS